MSGLFGAPDNSAAMAAQQQQLELQKQQQAKLDDQERDREAALLARARAGTSGGMRTLIAGSSLGNSSATGATATSPGTTLGSNVG